MVFARSDPPDNSPQVATTSPPNPTSDGVAGSNSCSTPNDKSAPTWTQVATQGLIGTAPAAPVPAAPLNPLPPPPLHITQAQFEAYQHQVAAQAAAQAAEISALKEALAQLSLQHSKLLSQAHQTPSSPSATSPARKRKSRLETQLLAHADAHGNDDNDAMNESDNERQNQSPPPDDNPRMEDDSDHEPE